MEITGEKDPVPCWVKMGNISQQFEAYKMEDPVPRRSTGNSVAGEGCRMPVAHREIPARGLVVCLGVRSAAPIICKLARIT